MIKYLVAVIMLQILVSLIAIGIATIYPPPETGYTRFRPPEFPLTLLTVNPNGEPVYIAISEDILNYVKSYRAVAGYRYALVIDIPKLPTYHAYVNKIVRINYYLINTPQLTLALTDIVNWSVASNYVNLITTSTYKKLGVGDNAIPYYEVLASIRSGELRIAIVMVFDKDTRADDFYTLGGVFNPADKLSSLIKKAYMGNYTIKQYLFYTAIREIKASIGISISIRSWIAPDLYTGLRILMIVSLALAILALDYGRDPGEYGLVKYIIGWFKKNLLKRYRKPPPTENVEEK